MQRQLGPICASRVGPSWIDTGTNALTRHAPPGPTLGAGQARRALVQVPGDSVGRLLLGAQCGLPLLGGDVRQRLTPLLTYEGMAVVAGSVLALGAAHAIGVGFAADIVVGTLTIAVIGQDAIEAMRRAAGFYRRAMSATTEKDFEAAGRDFASFVSIVGINALLALLLRARPTPKTARMAAVGEGSRAAWMAYIGRIRFKVPAGKAMLWSQVGAERAEAIARSRGLVSLEMLLKEEGFIELYNVQFGASKTQLTGEIWRAVSQRYAASLEGKVTAVVHQRRLSAELVKRGERGLGVEQRGVNPVLIDEIEEIAEIMQKNSRISSVEMIDESSGRSWLMLREQVLEAAGARF